MTREEAAEQLKSIIEVSKKNERNEKEIDGYDEEALEMAIDALIDIEQINEIISAPFQESALKYQMIRDIVGGKDNTITTGQHCKDCECGKPDLSTWGTSRIPNHYTVYYGSSNTWSIKDVADTLVKHGLIAEQEPCEDCISRQAVLDAIDAEAWAFCDYLIRENRNDEQKPVSHFADNLRDRIGNDLLSVTPAQKRGRWIDDAIGVECFGYAIGVMCSECGKWYENTETFRREMHYCPNCGARMVEPQESEGEG